MYVIMYVNILLLALAKIIMSEHSKLSGMVEKPFVICC